MSNDGAANNLRPGEKVTVSYRNAHGVLVADHIEQQPMRFAGIIKRIDPNKRTLVLRRRVLFMQLDISPDCVTVLPNEKAGSLADIHPGDQVTKTSATSPVHQW